MFIYGEEKEGEKILFLMVEIAQFQIILHINKINTINQLTIG